MGTIVTIAALSLLWPAPAFAKRKAPTPVPPVVWNGVEYRAPLDVEHMGRVQAFEVQSGRKLWETKVYHVWFNPLLEADVQWVFIKRLQVQNAKLLVTNESGKTYRLDPKTGKVEDLVRVWFPWLLAGCLLVVAAFFVWVWKGRSQQYAAPDGNPVASSAVADAPRSKSQPLSILPEKVGRLFVCYRVDWYDNHTI